MQPRPGMRGLCTILLTACLLLSGPLAGAADIAIIIDDLGNNADRDRRAIELPGDVTLSIMPFGPQSIRTAELAKSKGREIMVHFPMQALDGGFEVPGMLTGEMSRREFLHTLERGLAAVPYAAGMNNHMGSLLTRSPERMNWLMEALARHGDLYFIDSRTTISSVAHAEAQHAGLRSGTRDVFLDHDRDPAAIRVQFQRLLLKAQTNGHAIGIAHPYPETMAILEQELPRLAAQGIRLRPVSQLIQTPRRRERLWLVYSYPLPKDAKN